jgi:hypothetical protein
MACEQLVDGHECGRLFGDRESRIVVENQVEALE